MAKLTITDAARVTGVSRMLLYRYIKSGKLSRTPEGLIDTAERLRAGLMFQTSDVTIPVTLLHDVTPLPVTPVTPVTSDVTPAVSTEAQTLERLIHVLQRELDAARERETLLLQRLSQMQQQNQRLLDMPRPTPPPESAQEPSGATLARRRPEIPRHPPATAPGAARGPGRGPERRHAPAHRGPAPGASRRPHARRDADPAWRRQEFGRHMPGDAALWVSAAGGTRAVCGQRRARLDTVTPFASRLLVVGETGRREATKRKERYATL
jgi:hypothetical protein